jgi:hypothetical protein
MTYDEMLDLYRQEVKDWAQRNGYNISNHVCDIIQSVLMTRDKIDHYPGHFAQAVVNNDLREAINRADQECLDNLKIIYQAYFNIDTWQIVRPYRLELSKAQTVENE